MYRSERERELIGCFVSIDVASIDKISSFHADYAILIRRLVREYSLTTSTELLGYDCKICASSLVLRERYGQGGREEVYRNPLASTKPAPPKKLRLDFA